jgi:hypothetical protein
VKVFLRHAGDCIPLVTAASAWPERKISGSNLNSFGANFYIRNPVLAPNEFKLEPEIFLSGQELAGVTKGIQSLYNPLDMAQKKPLLNTSLVV